MSSELNIKELSDETIGNYIIKQYSNDANNELESNSFASLCSDLPLGLFEWYPFRKDSNILHVEAGFGGVAERLCNLCKHVTITETNEYKAHCAKERLKNIENITVVSGDYKSLNQKYDYILYVADKYSKIATNLSEYETVIKELKGMLTESGKLLLVVHNSLGVKYLCGTPNPFTDIPFDSVDENDKKLIYFTREEVTSFFKKMGFQNIKMYYPFPDYQTVGVVYSENYKPTSREFHERLRVSLLKENTVLDEALMLDKISKNANILSFSNSFFIECGNTESSNVLYATLSIDRSKDKSSVTRILDNKVVEKFPIYKDGEEAITILFNNTKELKKICFPILDMQMDKGKLVMPQVEAILLDDYISTLIKENKKEEFLKCIDKLYKCILSSSEHVSANQNKLLHYAPDADWGVILKKAYLDMVSVNCFVTGDKFLFFDQEFVADNYPAKYVLYKCIYRIYSYLDGAEKIIPLENIKKLYGLENIWKYIELEESKFNHNLCQEKPYFNYYYSNNFDKELIKNNREKIKLSNFRYDNIFNVTSELNNKQIILFGAGKFADNYLKKYGESYAPLFIVDNNSEKWGAQKNGIEIKNPLEISKLIKGTYRIIIAISHFMPIIRQLQEMGVSKDDYRVYQREMDELVGWRIENPINNGKYNTGYTMGVFDLFHIGHLNLLKRSKEKCKRLVVGVINDEAVKYSKHKNPYIPFEERIEIVRQCKYVDDVIEISLSNPNSMNTWKNLQYDCFFMGNDHENEDCWLQLKMQLESVGANIEFFDYTEGTSSTKLQGIISKELGG